MFGFKTFNDRLALLLVSGILGLWVFHALVKPLPAEIIGASILQLGLIVQYYFRKAPENKE